MIAASSELPRAYGGPVLRATLRATAEDFRVEEILGYDADGHGEHVLLWVEKRDANTDWVARELAKFAGVPPVAVGYAGLKDRHAVTRQTFSVQLAGKPDPDWSTLGCAGVAVLAATRHSRKLKRGALRGNRFVLTLRDVQGDPAAADALLAQIAARGVPNYFGEQRFGRAGNNVAQARAMFAGRRVERNQRSMLLSAARSQIFNDVLATRVERGVWDTALDGEIWSLAGSHSWFGPIYCRPGRAPGARGHSSVRSVVGPRRVTQHRPGRCTRACGRRNARRSRAGVERGAHGSGSARVAVAAARPEVALARRRHAGAGV